MSIQSASGNHESASSLAESLAKLNKLTSKYTDNLDKIHEMESTLYGKVLKGCSDCSERLVNSSKNSNDKNDEVYKFTATGIEYSTDNLSEVEARVNTLILYIDILGKKCGDYLDGTDDTLEGLAVQIKRYQNEINKTLSGETKKKALKKMIKVVFASNKYDAKSMNGIPKEKILTNLDNWEGDLKFVRQDNGTYLVIKVGKDGSEVPMGYTTKEGKNAYYKEAKEKVLNSSKEKNKSSKEKTTSSKEKTTSSKEKTTSSNEKTTSSNEETTSNSNSKSDSNSGDYVEVSDINKSIRRPFENRVWEGSNGELTSDEKMMISKGLAKALKDKNYTKANLGDCDYTYSTVMKNGKKVVTAKVSRYVADEKGVSQIDLIKEQYKL